MIQLIKFDFQHHKQIKLDVNKYKGCSEQLQTEKQVRYSVEEKKSQVRIFHTLKTGNWKVRFPWIF